MRETTSPVGTTARLVELIYELMDAHDDTTRLAHEFTADLRWQAHLDYLQQLQRVGRQLLATSVPD